MLPVLLTMNRLALRRRMAKNRNLDAKSTRPECCRTCLGTKDLTAIFESKETQKKRSEELRITTGLQIHRGDGLSQKICRECLNQMRMALKFRRTSRKAQKSLLSVKPEKLLKKVHRAPQNEVKYEEEDCGYDYDDPVDCDDYEPIVPRTRSSNTNTLYHRTKLKRKLTNNDTRTSFVSRQLSSNCDMKENYIKTKEKKKKHPQLTAKGYKCNLCHKEFQMKTTYNAHVRFHTNYCVCEECGKRCRNNNQLQEHKRAKHGLGKIHKCAYCEYSSATKEALTIHERRHTGEKPYICDHCGASFHRRSTLVQHLGVHMPEKNFQCDMCPKRLKSKKFLQIHKHNAHTGKRYGYLCPICEHRFDKPNKVRAHARRVHGIPDEQHGTIIRVQL